MKLIAVLAMIFSIQLFSKEDEKPYCYTITKEYIENNFNNKNFTYIEYLKLINSRKVKYIKGQSVSKYIEQDNFQYKSIKFGEILVKSKNSFEDELRLNDQIILPFCATKSTFLRDPANAENTLKNKQTINEEDDFEKLISFQLSTQVSQLTKNQSGQKVDMNTMSVGVNLNYKLSETYTLTSQIGANIFTNIKFSGSNSTIQSGNIYPIWGVGLARDFKNFNFKLGHKSYSHLILANGSSTLVLRPVTLSKLSFTTKYMINSKLSSLARIGLIKSFGSDRLTGYDYSLGLSYRLGKTYEYELSAVVDQNSLNHSSTNQSDDSTAFGISFSYNF